jgi:hypothetical protein
VKITIESTSKIVHLNNVPARIWEGMTESGIPVHCYVTRIAVAFGHNCAEFEKELQEHRPPSTEVAGIPLRMIL